ncbi:RidA family protein [Natranaerobius thermophilus]|uniref:Endoribonuclease L-PSP n=1 Tax=Natranaerobius thermophilus (strain ATCC BAA-1301 / DSM 18059 / JW/NM-WN-LF) TaxID=457570 RepID=B2A4P4_NATTJ|nr:RidA family protein [Natranaerobius thermophilus]ACB85219.1 Endoribonuclease L-PSP [Natranaerobius thermophilus JW/NM-WN-LF]
MNKPNPEKKLQELGIELPEPPKPVASYVPSVKSGNMVFVSGQIPLVQGNLQYEGKVGGEVSLEDAYEAAKLCTINCLSVVKGEIGDLSKIKKIVKVTGYVSSESGFNKQPQVINGSSDFLGEVFGEVGEHSRAAVGVSELPLNSPVEVDMIVEIEE